MNKKNLRIKRANRVRLKLKKSSNLRLSLFRSSKHIYVQLIDDNVGKTLLSASSHDKSMKDSKLKPQEVVYKVGEIIGGLINDKKIGNKIAFDRGAYLYHGRVKQLAEGVRSKGISL